MVVNAAGTGLIKDAGGKKCLFMEIIFVDSLVHVILWNNGGQEERSLGRTPSGQPQRGKGE